MSGNAEEHVQLDAAALDSMETGGDFGTSGHVLMAVLGIAVPVLLLVWGWL